MSGLAYGVTWVVMGLIVGALALAARVGFATAAPGVPRPRLVTLGVGIVAAIIGGLSGRWLFGPFYANPTALWVSVLFVVGAPLAARKLSERLRTRSQDAATD